MFNILITRGMIDAACKKLTDENNGVFHDERLDASMGLAIQAALEYGGMKGCILEYLSPLGALGTNSRIDV